MTLATPPSHGATNWDAWLVAALTSLDSNGTSIAAQGAQIATNLTTVINTLNSIQASLASLQNQVNNIGAGAVAVWQ